MDGNEVNHIAVSNLHKPRYYVRTYLWVIEESGLIIEGTLDPLHRIICTISEGSKKFLKLQLSFCIVVVLITRLEVMAYVHTQDLQYEATMTVGINDYSDSMGQGMATIQT